MALPREQEAMFASVARWPAAGAAVCFAAGERRWEGIKTIAAICSTASLPLSHQGVVGEMLLAGAAHGLFKQHSPLTWSPLAAPEALLRMAWMLEGTAQYVEHLHRDADEVEVVLTKPARPSALETALRAAGYDQVGVVDTGELFRSMACAAKICFTVMTPFLDDVGAAAVIDLFSRTEPAVERRLIVRGTSEGPPSGLIGAAAALRDLRVGVCDYRLERENGSNETFHAKVVLTDRDWAYVGSSNMTQWSLAYSMELGVCLKGRAAGRIARVLDAVRSVARPMS